jgi:hypothetical protein
VDSLSRLAADLLDDIAAREFATERLCCLCLDARRLEHGDPVWLFLCQPPNRLSRITHITQLYRMSS